MDKEVRGILKKGLLTCVILCGTMTLVGSIGRLATTNCEGDEKKTELNQTFSDVAFLGASFTALNWMGYAFAVGDELKEEKRKNKESSSQRSDFDRNL